MAAAAVQGEQLDKILQCSICIDVFTDPRTLPCLHTFCVKCIADWCKNTQPGCKVTCPECREEFVIPDSGVGGLKKNFFVANLLSINEGEQKTEELCEICVSDDKKVSQMFCLQCEQSYCETCSNAHLKMKVSNSHKLVRLEKLQSGVDINKKYRPQYCDKHSEELIKLYCLDDEVAICMMCCVLDHRSHRCEEIKKIANQFRSGKWKQDLQTALSDVEKKMGVLSSKKINFNDKIKIVENKICEEADKKIQLIMNHRRKLISSLQNIKTHHEREIDRVNEELTRAKALLSTFKDHCEELLKKRSDVDICRERNSLSRTTEELVNIKHLEESLGKLVIPNVNFSSSCATFEDTKSVLGELEADESGMFIESKHKSMLSATPAVTVKSGVFNKSGEKMMLQGTSTVTVKSGVINKSEDRLMLQGTSTVTDKSGVFSESKHKSMLLVTPTVTGAVVVAWDILKNCFSLINSREIVMIMLLISHDNPQLLFTIKQQPTHNNCLHSEVFGVALLDNCLCVVYKEYDKVYVFDAGDLFQKIKNIQVDGLEQPDDMVGCSVTSQLFVSDNAIIFRVNVNTGVSDVFIKLGCNNAKLSLVANRLLVTSDDSLLMHDIRSGRRMKNIPLTKNMKKYGVDHAIESNRDSFFVCHGQSNDGPSTVSEIDSEGRVIRVFNNKKKLNCVHLALDSVGRLLVVDYDNHSVVLLDANLQFIKILLDKELLDDEDPCRLNYNKNNNRLAVGLDNGYVKIFDFNV